MSIEAPCLNRTGFQELAARRLKEATSECESMVWTAAEVLARGDVYRDTSAKIAASVATVLGASHAYWVNSLVQVHGWVPPFIVPAVVSGTIPLWFIASAIGDACGTSLVGCDLAWWAGNDFVGRDLKEEQREVLESLKGRVSVIGSGDERFADIELLADILVQSKKHVYLDREHVTLSTSQQAALVALLQERNVEKKITVCNRDKMAQLAKFLSPPEDPLGLRRFLRRKRYLFMQDPALFGVMIEQEDSPDLLSVLKTEQEAVEQARARLADPVPSPPKKRKRAQVEPAKPERITVCIGRQRIKIDLADLEDSGLGGMSYDWEACNGQFDLDLSDTKDRGELTAILKAVGARRLGKLVSGKGLDRKIDLLHAALKYCFTGAALKLGGHLIDSANELTTAQHIDLLTMIGCSVPYNRFLPFARPLLRKLIDDAGWDDAETLLHFTTTYRPPLNPLKEVALIWEADMLTMQNFKQSYPELGALAARVPCPRIDAELIRYAINWSTLDAMDDYPFSPVLLQRVEEEFSDASEVLESKSTLSSLWTYATIGKHDALKERLKGYVREDPERVDRLWNNGVPMPDDLLDCMG